MSSKIFLKLQAIRILHRFEDEEQLVKARRLVACFSESFCRLYDGNKNLTFTFHCVTQHLVDNASKHGSLVGHSMFSTEGAFGFLIRSLNGTRGFSKQIISSKYHVIYNVQVILRERVK